MPDQQEPSYSTRREFLAATLVAVAAALVLGILWLVARGAPSATRDLFMTPPVLVPTPAPPQRATPVATPASRRRQRTQRQRRERPANS